MEPLDYGHSWNHIKWSALKKCTYFEACGLIQLSMFSWGVWIRWTETLEWNGGMDWTGPEWNGMEGLVITHDSGRV